MQDCSQGFSNRGTLCVGKFFGSNITQTCNTQRGIIGTDTPLCDSDFEKSGTWYPMLKYRRPLGFYAKLDEVNALKRERRKMQGGQDQCTNKPASK